MSVQVSYPGVYIDEFTPAAPIQGAGTSVAAFVGLCKYGPPNEPKLITSWDAFLNTFSRAGEKPEDDDYLWYAVRGFFENGGKICFVTALSNSTPDKTDLFDESGAKTITVKTRLSGQANPPITVSVDVAHTVSGAELFHPEVSLKSAVIANDTSVKVAATDAPKFRAGDRVVFLKGNNTLGEEAAVVRVDGEKIVLDKQLQAYTISAKLRLAQIKPYADSFRADKNARGLVVGSIVTLSQDPGGGAALVKMTTLVTGVVAELIGAGEYTYRVTVRDALSGFTLYGTNPVTLQSEEFTLTVQQGAQPPVTYGDLSMNPGHPKWFAAIVNADPAGLVRADPYDPPNLTAMPANRPKTTVAPVPLTGGINHDPLVITLAEYKAAFNRLDRIRDVNMLLVPGCQLDGVQQEALARCSSLYDRFAILDAKRGSDVEAIQLQRNGIEHPKGFAALYYPWIEAVSAKTGKRILLPPSGHLAGVYARTDLNRGVHKAPAGMEAVLNGALGVERLIAEEEQGILNLKGINVIRVFQQGGRPVVWGARTTSEDTNWQYVNIRRLFLFLEESIQTGIRGAVFEPNNIALWQKLKRTISAFLTQQWRDGALFGDKAEDAFYVRIDEALNPDSERALGRLYIEIGVRPSYPAEFIIVRIGIWQGGSEVSEA